MGTPAFAVPSLRAVAAGHEVVAVYTRPDRPAGRGRALTEPEVKAAALELGLPVRQPESMMSPDAVDELRSFAPDMVVVAAYGAILSQEALDIPRLGTINVHASLLPRWRGAAPIQRAILAGDPTTGVTIMRVVRELDAGPYCLRRAVAVDDHTTESLTAELASAGAEALTEALPLIEGGTAQWTEQEPELVTYAPKITPADVALFTSLTATEAYRRIRASTRQAPSRLCVEGRDIVATEAVLSTARLAPGELRALTASLLIGLADGALEITRLTPEGRAAMSGGAFARGARLPVSARWDACSGA